MKNPALAFAAAAALLLSSCSGLKDAFSAHTDRVATAGDAELTVPRLGQLLGKSRAPIRKDIAKSIASVWVDYQLLGLAAAENDSLKDPKAIDEDANRRLTILEHHTQLGAGYQIALKDLELRGAGNLLGPEQSGFVHAVGFDMYLRMLDETVKRVLRGDDAPKLQPAEISLDLPSYLPDDYIISQDAKLDIYRRLTHMTAIAEIEALRAEVRDRFGVLPEPARVFFGAALLRVLGGASDIESVLVRGNEARITFREHAVPRMKGISAAFHEVQFQAEVRRAHPLSLKLTRLGGAEMLDGLVRALTTLRPA